MSVQSPPLVLQAYHFTPFVGRQWLVSAQPKDITLQLDEVDNLRGGMPGGRDPFVLIFSTPWDTLLVEGHYLMRPGHDAEAVSIHLIPTQTAPGPRRSYHAVFN
jgi:hypothetical protein